MIKLRMVRKGVAHKPVFRIIAIESRSKNDGKIIENLGYWSKLNSQLVIKQDRIDYWVAQGAQMSQSLRKLLTNKDAKTTK